MSVKTLLKAGNSISKSFAFFSLSLIPEEFICRFSSICSGRHPFPPTTQPPPAPKKIPFTVSVHGRKWKDPYHWMSNINDPDLSEYLRQENSYAEAFMADTQKVQRKLYSEMTSRLPAKISTPPERWGPWLYYQHVPEGKEYPVLCRRLESRQSDWLKTFVHYVRGNYGKEEILLDWNEVAKQYGYVHVGTCRISPDHNFLAYTVDITGGECFLLQIKDLRNGRILPKLQLEGVVSLAWSKDSTRLFYTLADESQRPYRVCCANLGQEEMKDVTVFVESNSNFCVDITSTKDGKFITVYIIDVADPLGGLRRMHKRIPDVQYFLEHHHGIFYILTNAPLANNKEYSGENYYLAICQAEDSAQTNWQAVILPGKDLSIQDMDIFNRHLVLSIVENGYPMFCSINLPLDLNHKHQMEIRDLNPWFFPPPSESCSLVPGSNHDFMNCVYRVVLSSPVMPDVIVDYNMSQRTFEIVHQEEVGDAFVDKTHSPDYEADVGKYFTVRDDDDAKVQKDPGSRSQTGFSEAYCCETNEVISHDGIRIPMTILYSRKMWQRGQSFGLLLGYGAYGEAVDKSWCPEHLSLLDRGFVIAFADVRGGGGHGSSWHKSGSGSYKKNSIYDFISCAKYLTDEGYVHKDRLCSVGVSAGCLLVGAAINMHPGLFQAAILKVPFLDICNTMLDPSLPLTTLDYEEFGNPQIQSQFESILSYSPYDNINQGSCYPSVLVTASFHDSRVGVWEAAKWVAKVRDVTCSSCSHSTILKTNMVGGHFGEGGRNGQCEEAAYNYAFLMKALGLLSSN